MSDLVAQTKNAFEFIGRLYLETSYFIKEVEGQLGQEPERFVILRPSGYQVSAPTSLGLEANFVTQWWLRKAMAVAFTSEASTKLSKGVTITQCGDSTPILFLTIVLEADELKEPTVFFGVLDRVTLKAKNYTKFEHAMWELPQNWRALFATPPGINFEDGYCGLRGRFAMARLFAIHKSEDVRKKVVQPMLDLAR